MLVQVLRRSYGNAHISYIVGKGGGYDILKNDSNIDELIPANVGVYKKLAAGEPYDLAIDLYGGGASRLMAYLSGAPHRILRPQLSYKNNTIRDRFLNIARLLRVELKDRDPIRPVISITKKEGLFAARFLKKFNIREGMPLVGLQPERHYEVWPELKYAELAKKLIEVFHARIILFSGPGEKTAAQRIHTSIPRQSVLLPPLAVREYFAVLSKCHLLMTTIGGAAHAGPALGVPTVVILTRRQANYWVPDRRRKSFYLPIISKASNNSKVSRFPKGRIFLTISTKRVFDLIRMQRGRIFEGDGRRSSSKGSLKNAIPQYVNKSHSPNK